MSEPDPGLAGVEWWLWPREVARGPRLVSVPPPGPGGAGPSLLRDASGRRHLYYIGADGTLKMRRWNDADAAPVDATLDAATTCATPHFSLLHSSRVEGAYVRGNAPKLARTVNYGNDWSIVDIPGEYTATTSVVGKGRRVLLGYRVDTWYARVGVPTSGGTYTWSSEQPLGLSGAAGVGSLMERVSGTLEFAYQDTAGNWKIASCKALKQDGTGTWA